MKFKLIVDSKRGVWGAYGRIFRPGREYPITPEIAEAASDIPGLTVIEMDTKGEPISVKEAEPILVKEEAPKKKGKKEKPFVAKIEPIKVKESEVEELNIELKSTGAKPIKIKKSSKKKEKEINLGDLSE